MRYHPVSLNVIRQALKISALPQPRSIRRKNQFDTPDGSIMTLYSCEYDYGALVEVFRASGSPVVLFDNAVMSTLDTAFCSDIAVVSFEHDGPKKPAFIGLVTIFNPYERLDCND